MSKKEWIFIIDTEQYAGNFERSMCAFMTGMIGECEVGISEAKLYYEQTELVEKDFNWEGVAVQWSAEDFHNPFANFVMNRRDEDGCGRPTSCWSTPGWFNHGMGGYFRDGQETQAHDDHKKKCLEHAVKEVHYEAQWKENSEAPLRKHDAHLSVAIFFSKGPTNEMCKLMIKRAKAYVEEYSSNKITITRFRLLVEETKQTEEYSWEV